MAAHHNFDDYSFEDLGAYEAGSATSYSSPAVPVFDASGGQVPTGTNMATVSPQDLMIGASAPNSSALTNLTSPSVFGSPGFDNYNTSPAIDNMMEYGAVDDNSWPSLFPTDGTYHAQGAMIPPMDASTEADPVDPSAAATTHVNIDNNEDIASSPSEPTQGSSRRKSSNARHARHSSTAGVNARRRDKPLPPIIVDDPTDIVAMKRARNTLAARKSRQRKAERVCELEQEVEKLKGELDEYKKQCEYWKSRVDVENE